mmetsp:Transcript_33399/g.51242  ORF Transcript_33399/g.51242 Transcript_33399/m.51242 type:complete len:129 (+) Transcript_33399:808-1194(+)
MNIFGRRHYRWVNRSKRLSVKKFFVNHYNVPETVYRDNESVFVKLIFNTLKDLDQLGVAPNPDVDRAMDEFFRQKPNLKNTETVFKQPCIIKIWNNMYGGDLPCFKQSQILKDILREASLGELKNLIH